MATRNTSTQVLESAVTDGVLLLSGGLDSLTLLALLIEQNKKPICLSFDYGQRHRKELSAAKQIAAHYQVAHETCTLPGQVFAGSCLTGKGTVPLNRHFEDSAQELTVVPNRNMVFVSLAVSLAKGKNLKKVYFAPHKGDEAIYPDCRKQFVEALNDATKLACGVEIIAPFLEMDKRAIYQEALRVEVPVELAWSCYLGEETPCQRCGACLEREYAMEET